MYPVFRSIDIADLRRLGSDPPQPIRFALDVHLGKLASLLRLAGFDATIGTDDLAIARAAAREGRVVLTRDVGLLKRSIVQYGYWVRHIVPESQLAEVVARFELAERMEPFVRCMRCNTPLLDAAPGEVATRVPPRARVHGRGFRRCPGCERLYWQGSHYGRLQDLLERARRRS